MRVGATLRGLDSLRLGNGILSLSGDSAQLLSPSRSSAWSSASPAACLRLSIVIIPSDETNKPSSWTHNRIPSWITFLSSNYIRSQYVCGGWTSISGRQMEIPWSANCTTPNCEISFEMMARNWQSSFIQLVKESPAWVSLTCTVAVFLCLAPSQVRSRRNEVGCGAQNSPKWRYEKIFSLKYVERLSTTKMSISVVFYTSASHSHRYFHISSPIRTNAAKCHKFRTSASPLLSSHLSSIFLIPVAIPHPKVSNQFNQSGGAKQKKRKQQLCQNGRDTKFMNIPSTPSETEKTTSISWNIPPAPSWTRKTAYRVHTHRSTIVVSQAPLEGSNVFRVTASAPPIRSQIAPTSNQALRRKARRWPP